MEVTIVRSGVPSYVKPLSAVGLGCNRIGSFSNTTPLPEVRATLAMALDLGITVFDTAGIYGQGESEREIGRALRGRREEAFVVTKLGRVFSAKMRSMLFLRGMAKAALPGRAQQMIAARRSREIIHDFTPGRFAAEVDTSLMRLGFEYLDGLLLHSPQAELLVHDPQIGEALCSLQKAGKIRLFGVSCDDNRCVEAALAMPKLNLLQVTLPVLDEAIAQGLGPKLRSLGITVFVREVMRGRPSLLSPAAAVAAACAREHVTCVIVGVSSRRHLQEIADAWS
jgi:aryl-alcohol dehydrogenase-like predicted oxidoreductase